MTAASCQECMEMLFFPVLVIMEIFGENSVGAYLLISNYTVSARMENIHI